MFLLRCILSELPLLSGHLFFGQIVRIASSSEFFLIWTIRLLGYFLSCRWFYLLRFLWFFRPASILLLGAVACVATISCCLCQVFWQLHRRFIPLYWDQLRWYENCRCGHLQKCLVQRTLLSTRQFRDNASFHDVHNWILYNIFVCLHSTTVPSGKLSLQ